MMNTCWECGKKMQEKELQFTDKVKGEEFAFNTMGIVCDCGYKNIGAHQMDEYNIRLADAYREAHDLLTSDQIKKCRKFLNMTQQEFAEFLSVHVQSIKRWEHGHIQDPAMDQLIRFRMKERFPPKDIPVKTEIPEAALEPICYSVSDVVDFILIIMQHSGEFITHLKLQKLLYYTQAWFLAFYKRSLFHEEFLAWEYGPVERSTYDRFKHYQRTSITEDIEPSTLPGYIKRHIYNVMQVYAIYTAFRLAQLTHDEDPWKDARGDLADDAHSDNVVTKEAMTRYYQSLLTRNDICQ
ncbi:MAG: type II TA system antitoxin MqsA family protein [Vulcanimicrobiota bacterium]